MAAYQRYTDQAFDSARRQLDPVWDERRDRFNQQMVSRGFNPGSEAYDRAYRNLADAEDRSYRDASFDAMRFGSGRMDADRGFNLADRQFRDSQNRFNRQFREGKRQYDRGFGEQQRQFDEGTRRYGQDFDENQRRFDLGFREGQRQFDMPFAEDQYRNRRDFAEDQSRFNRQFGLTELSTLDNISRAYQDQAYRDAVFNASRDDQQMAQLMGMLGFAPQGGAQPFNMGSAFNNALTGEIADQNWTSNRNRNVVDAIDAASNVDWGNFFGGLFG